MVAIPLIYYKQTRQYENKTHSMIPV